MQNPRKVITTVVAVSLLTLLFSSCSGRKTVSERKTEQNAAMVQMYGGAGKEDAGHAGFAKECSSTREYVTALEYIRSHTEFSLNEVQSRDLAKKVASHCSGAADKFIRITSLLLKANLAARDAVENGLEMMQKPDSVAETFVHVFIYSFAPESLDLDTGASLQLAKSLSTEFDGNHQIAISDFHQVIDFCLDEKGLDLPRPQCGSFAARIAKHATNSMTGFKDGVAKQFFEAYRFLTSEKSVNMATSQALKTAEELVSVSPVSVENFIQAYRYAISQKGLALGAEEAFNFAKDMAMKTKIKGNS